MNENTKVWRYMNFSRFVWLLASKNLWLSRADLLGDPWEITLAGAQLDRVVRRGPVREFGTSIEYVCPFEHLSGVIKHWRENTFVNCWSAAEHESHALWKIYCPTREGVAVQATLATLRKAVDPLPVYEVNYCEPGETLKHPELADLIARKRHMFAYEHEVRIVLDQTDSDRIDPPPRGIPVPLDPTTLFDAIWIHPEADEAVWDAVSAVVTQFAPDLRKRISWSSMRRKPPF